MLRNKKVIIFLGLLLVFGIFFLRYNKRAPKRNYCDFRVYYATAERFGDKEDIYARPDEKITPFKYSPTFAMMVAPLALFSQKSASLIFFTINFACLLLIFVLSRKLIVKLEIPHKWSVFLYTVSLLGSFRFILYVLDSGQVGIVMLTAVIAGLYFIEAKKDALGSVFMATGIMVKYMPAVFLPYFALKKNPKVVFYTLIFVALLCLAPTLYVGLDTGIQYIKNWLPFISDTSLDPGSWYNFKNQSIYSFALRSLTEGSTYKTSFANFTFNQTIFTSLVAVFIFYLFIILRRKDSVYNKQADYSLLLILMALLNPNAWMHNFVIFIFVYMTIFYYLIKVGFKDKIVLVLAILAFALTTITSETFIGDNLEIVFEKMSCITVGTLILAASLFRIKFFPVKERQK